MTGHDCMDAGGRATQGAVAEETRNKLTDYWSNDDIKQGEEFAMLTNIIHQVWSEINEKDLKSQKLCDHMRKGVVAP